MANFKFVKSATALVLGASVLTTAVVVPGADASAKTTYKVTKSGTLVNAKTNKAIKGYKSYKGKLYNNGKKFTGLYSKKYYYKNGVKATGTYKGAYYYKGVKKVGTGVYNNAYYKNGVKATGTYKNVYYVKGSKANGVYNNVYYKNGVKATATYKSVYYVKGVKANGVYSNTYYKNGVKATGAYKDSYYQKGVKVNEGLFGGKYYKNGVLNVGLALYGGKLYNGSVENKGFAEFGEKYYVDAALANTTVEGIKYVDGLKATGLFDGLLFADGKVFTGDKDGAKYVDGVKIVAAVSSVGAINATEATVAVTLDKDVAEADLNGKKITLKGAQTLTATFVKADGKVATFKVDQDILNKAAYDGEYALEANFLDTANAKTTYSAVIAGTFVEGFVQTLNASSQKVALADATVKVGGVTTKTDANGYYQLAVNPGLKTVEISKGNDYFVQEADANVSRNFSTVINKDLAAVDVNELYYTGTILDSKDSKAVAGVDVQLQAKDANGEWKDVTGYTVKTDANGKFAFGNTSADSTLAAGSQHLALTSSENVLSVGTEYRVVAEKAVSASNLDNVYKKQVASFTVSNKKEETTSLVKVEKAAELQELKVDATWLKDSVDANTNDTVSVQFLNTDGVTELESFDLVKGTDFTLDDATGKSFKEAVDVVADKAKFANGSATTPTVKPRLVSGTYFMVVTNGTGNAKKAYAVEVTEGGKATVKFEMEQAKTAQAKTLVDKVQFAKSLYTDPKLGTGYTTPSLDVTVINKDLTRSATNVQASYAAYQTVAGKDIKIAETTPQKVVATFADDKVVSSISAADTALDQLAASVTYKVKSTSDFLVGNKDLTVKPDAATNSVNATVDAATKLQTIELTNKVTKTQLSGKVTVKSLKLVDKDGKTVAEATPNTEVTATSGVINVADLGEETAAKFTNIKANKYKLSIELAGYKAATSTEQELIDFQNGEIKVDVEAIKGTEVTGYVRYASNGDSVAVANGAAEATIIAYDKNGDAVKAFDFGKGTETTYSLTGLTAGEEYTFVVRGTGFETQAVKKTVVAEDTTLLNFDVVKGGQGKFKLQMVDSNNYNLDNSKINYSAKDAYYDVDNGTADHSIDTSSYAFTGQYAVTTPGAGATDTAARSFEINGVSAGSYKLELTGKATNDKYALPQTYNLTLKDVNGTAYSTSNGTEIIKVPLLGSSSDTLNVNIKLTVAGTAADDAASIAGQTDIDYIQVLDADGNIVKTVRGSLADVSGADPVVQLSVPNYKTYTVKAYLNNGYVSTVVVPVQNYDATATINVSQATR